MALYSANLAEGDTMSSSFPDNFANLNPTSQGLSSKSLLNCQTSTSSQPSHPNGALSLPPHGHQIFLSPQAFDNYHQMETALGALSSPVRHHSSSSNVRHEGMGLGLDSPGSVMMGRRGSANDSPTTSSGGENESGSPLGEEGDKNKQCECKECGKIFNSVWYLKQHAVKHSTERPFKCKFCHKTYRFRSNLYQHKCPDRDKTLGPKGSNGRGSRQNGGLARRQQSGDSVVSGGVVSPTESMVTSISSSDFPQLTELDLANTLDVMSPPPIPPMDNKPLPPTTIIHSPVQRANGRSNGTGVRRNRITNGLSEADRTKELLEAMNGKFGSGRMTGGTPPGLTTATAPKPPPARRNKRSKSEGTSGLSKAEVSQYLERFKHHLHKCQKCKLFFPTREYLTRHMASHAFVETRTKCLHCSESFQSEREYALHKQRHAPTSHHICPGCNGKFRSRLTLKRHQAECRPNSKFKASTPLQEFGFIDLSPPPSPNNSGTTTSAPSPQEINGLFPDYQPHNGGNGALNNNHGGDGRQGEGSGRGKDTGGHPGMNGFSELDFGGGVVTLGRMSRSLSDFHQTINDEIMDDDDSVFHEETNTQKSTFGASSTADMMTTVAKDPSAQINQSDQSPAPSTQEPMISEEASQAPPSSLPELQSVVPVPVSDRPLPHVASVESYGMEDRTESHVAARSLEGGGSVGSLSWDQPGIPYQPADRARWTPSPDGGAGWDGGPDHWPGHVGPLGTMMVQPRPLYHFPHGAFKKRTAQFLSSDISPMEADLVPAPLHPWHSAPRTLLCPHEPGAGRKTGAVPVIRVGSPHPSSRVPPDLEASPGRLAERAVRMSRAAAKAVWKKMSTRFECLECGKRFKAVGGLRRHMITHALPTFFLSSSTPRPPAKRRPVLRKLRKHRVLKKDLPPPDRSQVCPKCGAITGNRRLLNYHVMREHREDRPFRCSECHRAFKYQSNLKDHMTIHETYPRHSCPECGNRFRLKTNLTKHRVVCKGAVYQQIKESKKAAKMIRKQELEMLRAAEEAHREEIQQNNGPRVLVGVNDEGEEMGGWGPGQKVVTVRRMDTGRDGQVLELVQGAIPPSYHPTDPTLIAVPDCMEEIGMGREDERRDPESWTTPELCRRTEVDAQDQFLVQALMDMSQSYRAPSAPPALQGVMEGEGEQWVESHSPEDPGEMEAPEDGGRVDGGQTENEGLLGEGTEESMVEGDSRTGQEFQTSDAIPTVEGVSDEVEWSSGKECSGMEGVNGRRKGVKRVGGGRFLGTVSWKMLERQMEEGEDLQGNGTEETGRDAPEILDGLGLAKVKTEKKKRVKRKPGDVRRSPLRARPGKKPWWEIDQTSQAAKVMSDAGSRFENDGEERSVPHLPDQIVVPGMNMAVVLEAKMMVDHCLHSSSGSLSADMSALLAKKKQSEAGPKAEKNPRPPEATQDQEHPETPNIRELLASATEKTGDSGGSTGIHLRNKPKRRYVRKAPKTPRQKAAPHPDSHVEAMVHPLPDQQHKDGPGLSAEVSPAEFALPSKNPPGGRKRATKRKEEDKDPRELAEEVAVKAPVASKSPPKKKRERPKGGNPPKAKKSRMESVGAPGGGEGDPSGSGKGAVKEEAAEGGGSKKKRVASRVKKTVEEVMERIKEAASKRKERWGKKKEEWDEIEIAPNQAVDIVVEPPLEEANNDGSGAKKKKPRQGNGGKGTVWKKVLDTLCGGKELEEDEEGLWPCPMCPKKFQIESGESEQD